MKNAMITTTLCAFAHGLHRGWNRAVQTARLSCGVPDYDVYVQHLREHHPDREIPSYKAFFRERQAARYKGTGGRCC